MYKHWVAAKLYLLILCVGLFATYDLRLVLRGEGEMLRQRVKVIMSNIMDEVSEDFCSDNFCGGIKGLNAISWL